MSKKKPSSDRRRGRPIVVEPWYRKVPLMPVVVAALLVVGAAGVVVAQALNPSSGSGSPVDNIQCNSGEMLAVHYHAHLSMYVNGAPATLPSQIGITSDCLYWMHTHDTSGVIHIEAPKSSAKRKFTLGEFFDIWGKKLDRHHLGDATVGPGQQMVITVDGKPYSGDPRSIVLGAHTQVVIEITPPQVTPTPYTFAPGL